MTTKRIISALAIVCLALTTSAQYKLEGTVRDTKGDPVPFIVVALNKSKVTSTDGAGVFVFDDLKPGSYLLVASAVGYAPVRDTIELTGHTSREIRVTASGAQLDEVVVNATRVAEGSGMAFSNLSSEEIRKQNLGRDVPFVLNQLTNVVVNSDAGNGIGYSGMRIRGTDATRVNVTINGVPVNDAESQGTFWVDMPDLLSSVNSIQVQRGVGSSVNGAGAFGATINMQTNKLNEKPYANVISTAGSYNTFRNTIAAGTGLLNNHYTFDARASRITSDGYIDRAYSSLHSVYVSGGYYADKTVVKLIGFYGAEQTYQAWNYVREDSIKNGNRTYNELGEYVTSAGATRYYNNQIDHYRQANAQLHFIRTIDARLNFNVIAHYTRGKGYYEEYKEDQEYASYSVTPPAVLGLDSLPVSTTDLIRRRWLDNDFVGGIFNLNYKAGSRVDLSMGGGYNTYFGRHFGTVVWAQLYGETDPGHEYYRNKANKDDGNVYLKCSWRPSPGIQIYGDLQQRFVNYDFLGPASDGTFTQQTRRYDFFNPKAGASFDLSSSMSVYASAAVAHKEPNRMDFVENTPDHQPVPEEMLDIEAGVRFTGRKVSAGVNHYNMNYRNQLVLNGQLNDVGAAKRINVARSFRRGFEFEVTYQATKKLTLSANAAVSDNRILDYTEYADHYDSAFNYLRNEELQHLSSTHISMSPDMVTYAQLAFRPVRGLELAVMHKYVGRQYLDNTSEKSRSISPYQVVDVRASYSLKTNPAVSFMVAVYNVLNHHYETTGWTYNYYLGSDRYNDNHLAPAAPLNFLAGITLEF